jgi:hypothetical protein
VDAEEDEDDNELDDDDADSDCDGAAFGTLADVGTAAPEDDAALPDPDVVHAAASPVVSTVASATTNARTGGP